MPDYRNELGLDNPRYEGESPQFSRGNLDVRYPVDSAVQDAYRSPSNRQPLLNQQPFREPLQPNINPRGMRQMGGGLGGLGEGQETAGLWQTWKKILERTGNENLANQWVEGQQMAEYDYDDYGPFIAPSVREMDALWPYWTQDEDGRWVPLDNDYNAARGGLMSIRK